MAIRERKVKNKRNSQGILTGRPGIVYDVNVKVYENGKQKSIAKRGFATHREAELYEAQIKLELQTGSAAMVGYGPESKQKLKEYLPKWYESYHHNLAKSTRYSYWSGISIHLIPMLGEVPLNSQHRKTLLLEITLYKLLSLLAGNHELWATIRATNGFLQQIIVASGFWLVIVIA